MVWSSAVRNQFLATSLVLVLNTAVFASPKDNTLPPVDDVIFTMIARDAQRQSWLEGYAGTPYPVTEELAVNRTPNPATPGVSAIALLRQQAL